MAVRDRTRLTGPLASHKHEEGGPQAAFFVYGPIYQVEHKQLRGLEVPKIRGIVKAKRIWYASLQDRAKIRCLEPSQRTSSSDGRQAVGTD